MHEPGWKAWRWIPLEWKVVGLFSLFTLGVSYLIHVPIQWPVFAGLMSCLGLNYLLPFVLLLAWLLLPFSHFSKSRNREKLSIQVGRQIANMLCFGLCLFFHFHIKLWAPVIRPGSYDSHYESLDRAFFSWMDPLIVWRGKWLSGEWVDGMYINLFIALFACSLITHSLRGRESFRRVFLASLLVQALGAVAYLLAPAVGPFIYHVGANAAVTVTQNNFMEIHRAILSGGSTWLRAHTGEILPCGLAAMPSLHIAVAFVFLQYERRCGSFFVWFYWPVLVWIGFEAMATRWHYGVDLIAGVGLGWLCIFLSDWLLDFEKKKVTPVDQSKRNPIFNIGFLFSEKQ